MIEFRLFGYVLAALVWYVVLVGWWLQRDATKQARWRLRLRKRVTLLTGLFGWCVWGATFGSLLPRSWACQLILQPACLIAGLFVGYCGTLLIEPMVLGKADEEIEVMDDEPA
ncbi:MAG TPA: hypothetical protein VFG68_05490 [Fimbriiglobus sp.]|nr:hypothetical protein [Fimbriiglobus sp.]